MSNRNFAKSSPSLRIRPASPEDLNPINRVIEAAVLGWPLAERVKRLALPLLRYDAVDLQDYQMLLGMAGNAVVAVAVWCPQRDAAPGNGHHVLLHGLYVQPSMHGLGIGSALTAAVVDQARDRGASGVLVKAERVSAGYFERLGFHRLPANGEGGAVYPHRFWLPIAIAAVERP